MTERLRLPGLCDDGMPTASHASHSFAVVAPGSATGFTFSSNYAYINNTPTRILKTGF